jgi:hypothetical protein
MKTPIRLLLCALSLAACAPDQPGAAAEGAGDSARAAPAPPSSPARADTVTLGSHGLDVGGERFPFGAERARVLAALSRSLGDPQEQGTSQECPAGPMHQARFANGLQLNFQDGAFAGWFAGPQARLRTSRDVGPGSTLAHLRAAYPATTVESTSLGYEFHASGLSGIVTDDADEGRIEVVYAGVTCIFR